MARPKAAVEHRQRIDGITLALLLAIRQMWRRLDPKGAWEDQYASQIGPTITALAVAGQVAVTRQTDLYAADILNELAFGPVTSPGVLAPRGLAGLAGDGRPVDTLLAGSVGRARASLAAQREVTYLDGAGTLTRDRPDTDQALQKALDDGEAFMAMVTASLMSDSARAAEAAAMAPREWVDGWVRMINPPCCSRCAVLVGKFFLFSDGFERHPQCDCFHAPAPKRGPALDALLEVETPDRYFDSLSVEDQDRLFTQAGAQAIRDGADIRQVVNARNPRRDSAGHNRSGMSTAAQVGGKPVLVTTEGTTRQGLAYRGRTGRTMTARLMPESIYAIAGDDRQEAIRLMRLNGFIL